MSYFGNIRVEREEHALLNVFFNRELAEDVIGVEAVAGSRQIELSDATGFVVGSWIGVFNDLNNRALSAQVVGVASNVLTLDRIVNFDYEIGDRVARAEIDLNIDGSSGVQTFGIRTVAAPSNIGIVFNISRLIVTITDGSAMDDTLFGARSVLLVGCSIYIKRANGLIQHIFTLKSNGGIGAVSFDKRYNDKVGGGSFGLESRISFAGPDKMGSLIKLRDGDDLFIDIQDDLTPLTSFRIVAQGFATLE